MTIDENKNVVESENMDSKNKKKSKKKNSKNAKLKIQKLRLEKKIQKEIRMEEVRIEKEKRYKQINRKREKSAAWRAKMKEREEKFSQKMTCRFFLQGNCRAEEGKCPFSHDVKPDEMKRWIEPCKYYFQNDCHKGEYCCYMHETWPCRYYFSERGNICRNEPCRFSHEPMTPELKVAFDIFLVKINNLNKENVVDNENSVENCQIMVNDFGKSLFNPTETIRSEIIITKKEYDESTKNTNELVEASSFGSCTFTNNKKLGDSELSNQTNYVGDINSYLSVCRGGITEETNQKHELETQQRDLLDKILNKSGKILSNNSFDSTVKIKYSQSSSGDESDDVFNNPNLIKIPDRVDLKRKLNDSENEDTYDFKKMKIDYNIITNSPDNKVNDIKQETVDTFEASDNEDPFSFIMDETSLKIDEIVQDSNCEKTNRKQKNLLDKTVNKNSTIISNNYSDISKLMKYSQKSSDNKSYSVEYKNQITTHDRGNLSCNSICLKRKLLDNNLIENSSCNKIKYIKQETVNSLGDCDYEDPFSYFVLDETELKIDEIAKENSCEDNDSDDGFDDKLIIEEHSSIIAIKEIDKPTDNNKVKYIKQETVNSLGDCDYDDPFSSFILDDTEMKINEITKEDSCEDNGFEDKLIIEEHSSINSIKGIDKPTDNNKVKYIKQETVDSLDDSDYEDPFSSFVLNETEMKINEIAKEDSSCEAIDSLKHFEDKLIIDQAKEIDKPTQNSKSEETIYQPIQQYKDIIEDKIEIEKDLFECFIMDDVEKCPKNEIENSNLNVENSKSKENTTPNQVDSVVTSIESKIDPNKIHNSMVKSLKAFGSKKTPAKSNCKAHRKLKSLSNNRFYNNSEKLPTLPITLHKNNKFPYKRNNEDCEIKTDLFQCFDFNSNLEPTNNNDPFDVFEFDGDTEKIEIDLKECKAENGKINKKDFESISVASNEKETRKTKTNDFTFDVFEFEDSFTDNNTEKTEIVMNKYEAANRKIKKKYFEAISEAPNEEQTRKTKTKDFSDCLKGQEQFHENNLEKLREDCGNINTNGYRLIALELTDKLPYLQMDINCFHLIHKLKDPRIYNHPNALKNTLDDWFD